MAICRVHSLPIAINRKVVQIRSASQIWRFKLPVFLANKGDSVLFILALKGAWMLRFFQ